MKFIRPAGREIMLVHNWLCICMFFILSGAGSDFGILQKIYAEQISFVVAGTLLVSHFWRSPPSVSFKALALLTAMLGLLSCIGLSSLTNDHMLGIIGTSKFRQLVKVFVVGFGLFVLADDELDWRLRLTVKISLAVLVLSAGIRFFVMDQVNPETGRMNLLMRHGNANYIASICGALILIVLAGMNKSQNLIRLEIQNCLNFAIIGAALAIVLLSQSRMGFIALATGLFVLVGIEANRRKGSSAMLGFLLFMVVSAGIGISTDSFARFSDIADPSSLGRIKGIKAGIQLFADSPFFGVGFDQTPQHIYQITGYPMFRDFASPPLSLHNAWFQMLSEIGLVAFGFFALIWLMPVYQILLLRGGYQKSCLLGAWLCIFLNQQTLPAAYNDAFFALALLPGIFSRCSTKRGEFEVDLGPASDRH